MREQHLPHPAIVALTILAATFAAWLPLPTEAQAPRTAGPSVTLVEREHKTSAHPTKKYYASVWPDGLQVSFKTPAGHFGAYTFPTEAFPLNEPRALLSKGSPELLPILATRVGPNDFRIVWLKGAPPANSAKIVGSY